MTVAWLGKASRFLGIVAIGHALVRLEEYLFDYLLYPFMLYRGGAWLLGHAGLIATPAAGYWCGFGVMLAISTALNLLYLRAYDASKVDWFGLEKLRSVEARLALPRALRLPLHGAAFVGLSIWYSPIFAVLWTRSRSRTFTMARRDWQLFWLASLVANLGWSALVSGAVAVIRAIARIVVT